MRLASSPTVIDSGTWTSRTCLAAGPDSHMGALFLLAGALQRGEAAGAGVAAVVQRAGDGELAALAAMLLAAARRTSRLRPLDRGEGLARRPDMAGAALLVLGRGLGSGSAGAAGASAARRASSSA